MDFPAREIHRRRNGKKQAAASPVQVMPPAPARKKKTNDAVASWKDRTFAFEFQAEIQDCRKILHLSRREAKKHSFPELAQLMLNQIANRCWGIL